MHSRTCLEKSIMLGNTLRMTKKVDGIRVEWDQAKNDVNVKKHGISFETAALVFADEYRIEYLDKIHSTDEDRYITLGYVY